MVDDIHDAVPQKYEDLVDRWCQKRWARLCLKGEQDKPRDNPPHFQRFHAVFHDVPPETVSLRLIFCCIPVNLTSLVPYR